MSLLTNKIERAAFHLWRRIDRGPRTRQLFYDCLARFTMHQHDWGLMNFGFAYPEGREAPQPTVAEPPERFCLQLYDKVIGEVPLTHRMVLEIGCGRGGGARYLFSRFQPSRLLGVDYSKETIRFCRKTHSDPGLEFRYDDAMNLSFPDECFDAVLNIESSHCYKDKKKFFQETFRVLRKGGTFHYADNLFADAWPIRRSELNAAGFVVEKAEDISNGVLRAIEADEERRRGLIRRLVPWPLRDIAANFAGLPGGLHHERLREGKTRYCAYIARKPARSPDVGLSAARRLG